MTTFSDDIKTGNPAITSGLSSLAGCVYSRTLYFPPGVGTSVQTVVLPTYTSNLSGVLYIYQNGSAATSDRITVSAGGSYIAFASFGSANARLATTATGIGTVTYVGSACATVSTTSEATLNVGFTNTDAAVGVNLQLLFTRLPPGE